MKLIGAAELARQHGLSRHRMLTQLRAIEASRPTLRGKLIVHVGKRRKIWVDTGILKRLDDLARRELERRVAQLEAWSRGLEYRVDVLEARKRAG